MAESLVLAGDIGGTKTNLALTALATGGLYVGGGIAPKLLDRLHRGLYGCLC